MSSRANDLDMVAPWRRNFPICKPFEGGTHEEALIFLNNWIDGADGEEVGEDFTYGDVARGIHEGGNAAGAPAIAGPAATVASKTRKRDKRRKKTAALFCKYILVPGVVAMLKRIDDTDGEAMIATFRRRSKLWSERGRRS